MNWCVLNEDRRSHRLPSGEHRIHPMNMQTWLRYMRQGVKVVGVRTSSSLLALLLAFFFARTSEGHEVPMGKAGSACG